MDLYCVLTFNDGVEKEIEQNINLINMAKENNVKHFYILQLRVYRQGIFTPVYNIIWSVKRLFITTIGSKHECK
jgi:hypothetical protein